MTWFQQKGLMQKLVLYQLIRNSTIYNIYNGKRDEMNGFITVNSPCYLVHVIATNANGNREPHILSCHRRDQMCHYYLIESVTWEVLMFRFPNLTSLANYLFTEKGRLNLMNKLREYKPFVDISIQWMFLY